MRSTTGTATTSPAPPARPRWLIAGVLTGTLLITTGIAGTAAAVTITDGQTPAETAHAWADGFPEGGSPFGWDDGSRGGGPGDGLEPYGGSSGSGAGSLDVSEATNEQQQGVVIIETVNGYSSSGSAGTGIVLTEDGLVLTNNHVIKGSTEIRVTVPATGDTYHATVVGSDETSDIALIELDSADGLTVANLDDDGEPDVGDQVTGVGNAYGEGELVAADGTVTALDQTITTASSYGTAGATLDSLIEVDADIVAGDSGGPLLDDEGEVIGVNTAASQNRRVPAAYASDSGITAYAVPIEDAMEIVDTITAGEETDTVTIGYPAFLGVQLGSPAAGAMPGDPSFGGTTDAVSGAVVAGVIDGTPAAEAGLRAGDTITAVDDTEVSSGDELSAALDGYEPGDSVTITWTDTAGQTQSAAVTLAEGPA